jgi:unsaturated rhamnogalacturonyl hydrolase
MQYSSAQCIAGLDTWFNHETDAKTGKPFHYLWTDTAMSGFSEWGKIFKSRGADIISVGKPDPETLAKLDIYIIVDPDTTTENPVPNYITKEDVRIISHWVNEGGVLVVMSNDAPNCEFSHLNMLMKVFGITFNHVTLHRVAGDDFDMGATEKLPDIAIFKGVRKIYMKEISDIALSGSARPLLIEKGKVLMAENKFGKGYVFAVGDPWIYNEYISHRRLPVAFDNYRAAENLTDLLIGYTNKK